MPSWPRATPDTLRLRVPLAGLGEGEEEGETGESRRCWGDWEEASAELVGKWWLLNPGGIAAAAAAQRRRLRLKMGVRRES